MKKIFLAIIAVCTVANIVSAQKPIATIKGVEAGVNFILTDDDPLPVLYAGLIFPTKFENLDLTIGAIYSDTSDFADLGIYGGIDGHWGIFTAGISAGLSTIGYANQNTNFDVTTSVGLKLGWEKIYFKPQLSMIIGEQVFFAIKIPLTFTF